MLELRIVLQIVVQMDNFPYRTNGIVALKEILNILRVQDFLVICFASIAILSILHTFADDMQ